MSVNAALVSRRFVHTEMEVCRFQGIDTWIHLYPGQSDL